MDEEEAKTDALRTEEAHEEPPLLETCTEAKYLLVIEKQGIFLRLCEDAFHQ